MAELDIQGPVIRPGDSEYETARAVWNADIDRRPALVARPLSVDDVLRCVAFAAEHELLLAVRGGGHNVAGLGTCDDGIVVDLASLRSVVVDAEARWARVGGGATWADYDRATQAFGLASTGGVVSSTGVGGLTLGGGIGWLKRRFGLACDNLIGATVVTACGQVIQTDAESEPELIWGLKGGGGNFGVVVDLTFRLHPVTTVLAGYVGFPLEMVQDALAFYRDWASELPDELTSLFFFMPSDTDPPLLIGVCWTGELAEGERVLQPLRAFGPPVVDAIEPMSYIDLQRAFDDAPQAQPGFANYWKAEYLAELPDVAIHTIVRHLRATTSPLSYFEVDPMGGAVGRVPNDSTAFAHRDAPYLVQANAMWKSTEDREPHVEWSRKFWDAIRPWSAGGSYVNYFGEEGEGAVREAYGPAIFSRLQRLKRRFDPTNLFRVNQNIPPGEGDSKRGQAVSSRLP